MEKIKYKEGYKYQLAEDYSVKTTITEYNISDEFVSLSTDGILKIKKYYAWDGASGPTVDSKSSMRGSLVHDALYQLMRSEKISQRYRKTADILFHDMCIEDGMSKFRAWLWYHAVRKFALSAANAELEYNISEAP